jgi:HD-GYP domain-containing protein (c-di-GMP phosphodiesterase class II)
MNSFALKNIGTLSYFSKPTYLDSQFILTAPEVPFSNEMLRTINDWSFTEVLSDGEIRQDYSAEETQGSKENVIGDPSTIGDMDKIQKAELFYAGFQKYVKTLFAYLAIRNELDFNAIAAKIKDVCDYLRDNRSYLMRTRWLTSQAQDEDQFVTHTIRSTIIAVIIGSSLKLQPHRLIELGVAALLHEIGMLKLPQDNYQKKQDLTEQERKLLYAHPILGFNLLKSFNFPMVVSTAALEHHERENGTGYPQRKTGDKISQYAKIIAVACSYEAILSSRSYKGAKDSHTGIMELLKNEGKQYDDTIGRALVYSLSIYPIGLYVLLSNGKKGQVVDVNPDNPRCPGVQVFGELSPNGKNKTMQTSPNTVSIVRSLNSTETEN